MIRNFALVALGGMTGSLLRYLMLVLFNQPNFPSTTLLINITGSFIIGAVTAFALKNPSFGDYRLFLATGVCGGFTTFSAFSLECVALMQQNRNIAALIYILSSTILSISAAYAGYYLVTTK